MVFVHPPMLRLAPLVAIADGSAGAFATGHIHEAAISTEREVLHAVVHADAPENKIGKASKTLSQKLRGYQHKRGPWWGTPGKIVGPELGQVRPQAFSLIPRHGRAFGRDL